MAVIRLKDEEVLEKIAENTRIQSTIYKQRSANVQHPFGYDETSFRIYILLTRGLASVGTVTNLICLAINFKRIIKIKGMKDLIRLFRDQALSKSNMYDVYLSKIA